MVASGTKIVYACWPMITFNMACASVVLMSRLTMPFNYNRLQWKQQQNVSFWLHVAGRKRCRHFEVVNR